MIHRLFTTRCIVAGFAWGFAEGTVFFLVPDILITLVALFSFRDSVKQIGAVLLGSLVAGAGLYELTVHDLALGQHVVRHVPFVRERMFETTKRDFDESGVRALLKRPASGIPYKVYAVQAPAYCQLLPFLLVSIPARLERFVLTWAIFAGAGWVLRNRIASHPKLALTAHAGYWICVYAWYWSAI